MSENCRGLALSARYVAEDELHAYVDGQLSPARKTAVESILSRLPAEQFRLQTYRQQNIELHRLFDRSAEIEISEDCARLAAKLQRAIACQHMVRWFARGAAALGLIAAAVTAGWPGIEGVLHPENPMTVFARQATEAHLMAVGRVRASVTVPETAPEPARSGRPAEAPAIAGIPVPTPDLARIGFSLSGGRILPTARGPAVQLLYANDAGGKVTLFVGTGAPASGAAFTILDEEGMTMVYWQIGELGYSLIGNVDRARLLSLAESVIESLSNTTVAARSIATAPGGAPQRVAGPALRGVAQDPALRRPSLPVSAPAERVAIEPIAGQGAGVHRVRPAGATLVEGARADIAVKRKNGETAAPATPLEPKLSSIRLKPPT